jgi:hypothetical protein
MNKEWKWAVIEMCIVIVALLLFINNNNNIIIIVRALCTVKFAGK